MNQSVSGIAARKAANPESALCRWLEDNLGTVVSIERQERWRPAWFVELVRDGTPLSLYIRGDRESMGGAMSVSREGAILRVLEAHGIPVPHVYGEVPEANAIVMDRLPGSTNLVNAGDDDERRSVMDHYIDILAQIHAIDPAEFGELATSNASHTAPLALVYFDVFETRYRAAKERPEPLVEFAARWLRHNCPEHRTRAQFVLGDPGQFMFENGRVTGVLDVELCHFGDVCHDLAGLRLRNIPEPLGDVNRALRRYADQTGEPLDTQAIEFHTAQFSLCTALSLVPVLQAPPAVPEIVQYLEWFHQYSLTTIEAIAALKGVELADLAPLQEDDNELSNIVSALPTVVGNLATPDGIETFRRDRAVAAAMLAVRIDRFMPGIVAADLDDMRDVLGLTAGGWLSGDAALEAFVLEAGPEHDDRLIGLFHRRVMRRMKLLEPLLNRTKEISHVVPLA